MAFAIDHMGLTYGELREVRDAKFWKKSQAAAEEVKDLSVFRLVTNFLLAGRKESTALANEFFDGQIANAALDGATRRTQGFDEGTFFAGLTFRHKFTEVTLAAFDRARDQFV